MKISAVCCCMNRVKNLIMCLKSWVQFDEIQEIIIMDYGSDPPIKDISYKDKRIVQYRYDAEYWHLTKAYNIAIQLAKYDIILKLDTDYYLHKNFFHYHKLYPKTCIVGNKEYDCSLNGFLMIYKTDFININGYNENIINYGYDDDDIKNRLKKNNIKLCNINHRFITHIKHNDDERKVNNYNKFLTFEESVNQNKIISEQYDWTKYGIMSSINHGIYG